VGYNGRFSVFSSEAALKYFIIGTIFSIIMAYGIALLYLSTGLTKLNLIELYTSFGTGYLILNDINMLEIGSVFLLIGILFKLSAAPFHIWAPDVYEGASTTTTFFLFVVPKIALFILIINLNFL